MTADELRVQLAEAMGIEPVRRWRIWFDKDRQHGQIEMHSRYEALIATERAREDFARWGDMVDISEPEEYDSWCHTRPLSELVRTAEAGLSQDQRSSYARALLMRLAPKLKDQLPLACPNLLWREIAMLITAADEVRAAALLEVLRCA